MKVYNPKTKKNQDLFEKLIPVFTVGCADDTLVIGETDCAVYINVSAENINEAKEVALNNEEFMSHIRDKEKLNKDNLIAFKPVGNYVIGKVEYHEGKDE